MPTAFLPFPMALLLHIIMVAAGAQMAVLDATTLLFAFGD
jgi:hypothetical protein